MLGSVVRAELALPDGTLLETELSRDDSSRFFLRKGGSVRVILYHTHVFAGAAS